MLGSSLRDGQQPCGQHDWLLLHLPYLRQKPASYKQKVGGLFPLSYQQDSVAGRPGLRVQGQIRTYLYHSCVPINYSVFVQIDQP